MPKHSSSRKQQSRHDEGGESTWSEWVWSPEHGRYYCYRITRSGEHEYQWGNAETESHDAATPRQQADIPVDDITQGMENLEILGRADSDYTEGNYGDGGYDYAYGSPAGNSGEATHKNSKSMPSRSKGKAVDYDSLQDSGGPEPEPEEAPPLDPFYGAKTETEEPNGYEVEIPTQNPELFPSGTSQSGDYHGSSRYGSNQPNGYGNEDLNDATNAAPNYTAEETPAQDYAESSNDSAYAPYPSHSDGDAGSLTPTVTDDEQPLHISGTDGDHEQLDPRYKIERSTRFEPGMVSSKMRYLFFR
nr:uncharacterized protein CTRU02_07346 [Colletotrichum truncatum]KAF6791584.1 hypothetical protein CTRU02_07346 [Colletotrichum truncatum]